MLAIDETGGQGGTGATEDGTAAGDEPVVRRRWPILVAVAALAAVVVAVVVFALAGGDDEGSSLEDVAVSFAERLLTFDADDAAASIDAVLEVSAGEFAENYEAAADAGLAEVLERAGTESSATAGSVFVGPVDGDAATVVVEVEVVRRTSQVPEVTFTTYLVLELVDGDDGWAVVDVTPLEESRRAPVAAGEAEGDADEGPAATTTAPETTTTTTGG